MGKVAFILGHDLVDGGWAGCDFDTQAVLDW
jgi:hypothetical protein